MLPRARVGVPARGYVFANVRDGEAWVLEEGLIALASAGGTAVVTAAGTEAWAGLRQAVAGWFGRGDTRREGEELEELDRSCTALQATSSGQAERVRLREAGFWQARIERHLEVMGTAAQLRAAEELRALLGDPKPTVGMSAPGGLNVGRDVSIRASGGSIAGGVFHGGVRTTSDPHQPGPKGG